MDDSLVQKLDQEVERLKRSQKEVEFNLTLEQGRLRSISDQLKTLIERLSLLKRGQMEFNLDHRPPCELS